MTADLIHYSTGQAIDSGMVTFRLKCLSGTNAGKWWNAAGSTWADSEASAGSGTHDARGHWYCSIATAAWTSGVRYEVYATEAEGNQVNYRDDVVEYGGPALTVQATVET